MWRGARRYSLALRLRAPIDQQARTALADYAPTIGAVSGLLLGRFVPAPDVVASVVAGWGIAMALVGALLLGVAWPRQWVGRAQTGLALRGLALHLTLVPALLAVATLAGIDLPGAVWILALGPIPTSVVGFAQVYGYSARTAASGLAFSLAAALALAPLALVLAG